MTYNPEITKFIRWVGTELNAKGSHLNYYKFHDYKMKIYLTEELFIECTLVELLAKHHHPITEDEREAIFKQYRSKIFTRYQIRGKHK